MPASAAGWAAAFPGTALARSTDYDALSEWEWVVVWADDDADGRKAAAKALAKIDGPKRYAVGLDSEGDTGKGAADYSIEERRQMVVKALAEDEWQPPYIGEGVQRPPAEPYMVTVDADGLRQILDYLSLEVRKNARANRLEVRRVGADPEQWFSQWMTPDNPGLWAELGEDMLAELDYYSRAHFRRFDANGRAGPLRWEQHALESALLYVCPKPAIDPYAEWLLGIPEWDSKERIDGLWIETLDMPDSELGIAAGRRFMLGMVRRAMEPGCVHDWVPLLIGPQGLGKTQVCRELVSMSSEWFSGGTQIDGTAKERWETTGPAVLNEFAEMASLYGGESEKFKNWLSLTHDRFRPAFGRGQGITAQRRWAGVATGNDRPSGILPFDSTGARRYIVLKSRWKGQLNELNARSAKAIDWVRENRDQLHAEALAVYREETRKGNERMNTVGDLREAQEKAARGYFSVKNATLDDMAGRDDLKQWVRAQPEGKGATIAAIMVYLALSETQAAAASDKSMQIDLADSLKTAGYEKGQNTVNKTRATRWQPPLELCDECGKPSETTPCAACLDTALAATYCDEQKVGGGRCDVLLDAAGRCPVADTHAADGGDPPADDPPAADASGGDSATSATSGQQGLDGMPRGDRLTHVAALQDAITTRIAAMQGALDNPPPDPYDTPDELRRAIRAVRLLQAGTPWDVLGPRHVDALGGASVLVTMMAEGAASANDDVLASITDRKVNEWLRDLAAWIDKQTETVKTETQARWRETVRTKVSTAQAEMPL